MVRRECSRAAARRLLARATRHGSRFHCRPSSQPSIGLRLQVIQRHQDPSQTPPCATQQHPCSGRADPHFLGDLLAGHPVETGQTEDLGLSPGQLGQRRAQAVGKLARFGQQQRTRFPTDRQRGVGLCAAAAAMSSATSQQVQRPNGSQMPKQPRPLANGFTPVDFHRLQESLLDAIPRIGAIADQSLSDAPHNGRMLTHDRFPVCHRQAPVFGRGLPTIVDWSRDGVTRNPWPPKGIPVAALRGTLRPRRERGIRMLRRALGDSCLRGHFVSPKQGVARTWWRRRSGDVMLEWPSVAVRSPFRPCCVGECRVLHSDSRRPDRSAGTNRIIRGHLGLLAVMYRRTGRMPRKHAHASVGMAPVNPDLTDR